MKGLIAAALATSCLVSQGAGLTAIVRATGKTKRTVSLAAIKSVSTVTDRAIPICARALYRDSSGFTKTSSRRSCGDGTFGRRRDAHPYRRRPVLRTVSRPDFIQAMLVQVGQGVTVGLGTPI